MTKDAIQELSLSVSDVTRQKRARVGSVSLDSTVGELVEGLLPELQLPREDRTGRPLTWGVRLDREGRRLHASERIGDATRPDDELTLLPDVEAGGC